MKDTGMRFWQSSVGSKVLMAITGLLMIMFVIFHALGNTTIYFHWINVYSEHLHALPGLIWGYRIFMLAVLFLHVFLGVRLTLQNREAKPLQYVCRRGLRDTFASRNMVWTGAAIAAYLVYHLLHFTAQIINPELSASHNADAMGRPDVYEMVVRNFMQFYVSAIYIIAMIALGLHLTHGTQSLFQSLGLNNDKTMPVIIKAGALAAIVLALIYMSIPMLALAGILKG